MYYVISNGAQYGPYPLDKINRLLAAGQLKAEDIAWTEGMPHKVRLYSLPGIKLPAGSPHEGKQGKHGNEAEPVPQTDPYAGKEESHTPPGYSYPPSSKSGLARMSLLLGILGIGCYLAVRSGLLPVMLVYAGLAAGLGAILAGHVARGGIKRSRGRISGGGSALAGLICGYVSMVPAVLMVVLAFGYKSIINRGSITKTTGNIATISSYIDGYAATNNRQLPTRLQDLVTKRFVVDESLLIDSWGEPIHYAVPAGRSRHKYDVWSSGPDGISGNEDDIGNWRQTD